MKEIETTLELDAPRDLTEELLGPEEIIEYEGTYEVDGVGETEDGRVEVYASTDDIETAFAFEKLPNGYAFEQTGEAPFDEQYTTITVYGEDGEVEVVARSEFTFGGLFSVVLDWFAAGTRQTELQRTLLRLAHEIDKELDNVPDDVAETIADREENGSGAESAASEA